MASEVIEEIKQRLDIAEVVGFYLKLQKAGSNLRGLCPFHSEKKPSFFVSPKLQIFKCFGCGVSGDIFKFVMLIEGVEFGDALRILAPKAGVELMRFDSETQTARKRVYEICELATRFFEKQLSSHMGEMVRKYLAKRKIGDDSIRKWRIGWSPDTKNALLNFLCSRGYKSEEIKNAGLAFQRENGEYIDFFRGRIIFPIFDLNSNPIGFSGRVFGKDEEPKYINSPSTILYDKGRILYGLNFARNEIRKKDFAILVEGYTDVILAHQEGYENTISLSGTSLTQPQLEILKRYSPNLYLCFDADFAGDIAIKRSIDLGRLSGFEIKICALPEEKDPADILSENPSQFQEIIEGAVPIVEFYFQKALSRFDKNSLEGKKQIVQVLLPEIKRIQNEVEKGYWLSQLSKELDVKEEDLRAQLEKTRIEEEELGLEREEPMVPIAKSKKEILEERLLTLILRAPQHISLIDHERIEFLSDHLKEIITALMEGRGEIVRGLEDYAKELFLSASIKAENEQINEELIISEIQFCLKQLNAIFIKEKLAQISALIKEAEQENDLAGLERLSKEFNLLSEKIARL